MSKFQIGDEVETLNLLAVPNLFRGQRGIVKETAVLYGPDGSVRTMVYFPATKLQTILPESLLVKVKKFERFSRCECGSKYTSFADYHLSWCPEYSKDKK